MLADVDIVIASTKMMADVIKKETGIKATVIEDPYEFDEVAPSFTHKEGTPLKLLWFGHPSNIKSLVEFWPQIGEHMVMIVSDPAIQNLVKVNDKPIPIIPYSEKNILEALAMCDAVILPSEMGERQRVKSPNRLVEAVRRGKYVLADALPSYKAFDSLWIGDIKNGINWLQMQPQEYIEGKIASAQEYVRERHDPTKIGKQWEKVLCA
jgi:glycosyltransferase involved in cell wall biosynthesis